MSAMGLLAWIAVVFGSLGTTGVLAAQERMPEKCMDDNDKIDANREQLRNRYIDWLKPCRKSGVEVVRMLRRRFTLVPAACPEIRSVRQRLAWPPSGKEGVPEDKIAVSGYRVVEDEKSRRFYGEHDDLAPMAFAASEMNDAYEIGNPNLRALAAVERGIGMDEMRDETRVGEFLGGVDVLHRLGDNEYLAARKKEMATVNPYDYYPPTAPSYDPAVNCRLHLARDAGGHVLSGDFIAVGGGTAYAKVEKIAFDSITVAAPGFQFVIPGREENVEEKARELVRFPLGVVPGIPFAAMCTVTSENLRFYSANPGEWIPATISRRVRALPDRTDTAELRQKYAGLLENAAPFADPLPYLKNVLGLTLRAVPQDSPPWPDNAIQVFRSLYRQPEQVVRKNMVVYKVVEDAKSAPYYDDLETPGTIYLYEYHPYKKVLSFCDLLDAEIAVARGPGPNGPYRESGKYLNGVETLVRRGMMTEDGRRIGGEATVGSVPETKMPDTAVFPSPGEPLDAKAAEDGAERLDGRRRDVALALLKRMRASGGSLTEFNEKRDALFLEALGWRNDMAAGDVFLPGDDMYETVAALAGAENAALLRLMWERSAECPPPARRWDERDRNPRFRGKRLGCLYIGGNIEMLFTYLHAVANGFSLKGFLNDPAGWERDRDMFLPVLLAVRMDEGTEAERIFEQVKAALYEKIHTGSGRERGGIRDLAGGLARSRRPEAWQVLVGVQADPLLPEAYRLDILELANQGTFGAFKAMLTNESLYQNLLRGTPEQALVSWCGMDTAIGGVFWGERGMELVRDCLNWGEKEMAFALRDSDDYTIAYLALWAQSQRDVDEALETCRRLLDDGSRDQKLSALFWLTRLHSITLKAQLLLPLLEDKANWDDGLIMALIFRCLGIEKYYVSLVDMPGTHGPGSYPVRLVDTPGELGLFMNSVLYCTDAELERLRSAVRAYSETLAGPDDRPFGGRLWVFYHRYNFLFFRPNLLGLDKALMRR